VIEIRQYVPSDYLRISRRAFDLTTFIGFVDPYSVAENLMKGPAFTGECNGDIIACGGIIPLWKGVGEAWVVTSELVEKFRFTFAKVVWRNLRVQIDAMELDRVQTVIHKDHKVSIKWAERMGFVSEGLMRKYISGCDFYRFAWIRGK
jgi:hypothetical protein